MIGRRLEKCVCGGPHGWRCAWGILRDRVHGRLLATERGWWMSLAYRALAERQRMKLELRALQRRAG